ncbi:hypothetical protein ACQ4WX_48435 [Streptomyces lasalocidi]
MCRSDELGGGERGQMLAGYGTRQWSAVEAAVWTVVERHVHDPTGRRWPPRPSATVRR